MNQQLTIQEIKEGMTRLPWKIETYEGHTPPHKGNWVGAIDGVGEGVYYGAFSFGAIRKIENAQAICTAVNSTFGRNLDPTKYEEVVKALETTVAALKDLLRQLPNDESLADYRLDFAETADAQATAALSAARINSSPDNKQG